jgi:hypothetical protein
VRADDVPFVGQDAPTSIGQTLEKMESGLPDDERRETAMEPVN